jgi:PAS domain S-box-containing protein
MDKHSLILVVDDEESSRYTLSRYLKRAGFDVLEGKCGQDAINMSLKNPDLIVLDINLPDMLGYDVCRMIKSNPLTSRIPVLHTSATFTGSSARTRGLQGGADAYLSSPIDREEFLATVNALLRVRHAEAVARKLAIQWQSTFDAINDGILLVDTIGDIERANRVAVEMLGLSLEALQAVNIQALASRGLNFHAPFERMQRSRKREVLELAFDERWFRLTVDPIFEGDYFAGGVLLIRDITERKQSEQALQEAKAQLALHACELEQRVAERTQQLQQSVKFLEGFCYSIAHDLRAPLRALNGFVTALVDDYADKLDENGRDYTARISSAATRMDRLIHDLLEYGRLSHQALPCGPASLEAAIDDGLHDFRNRIQNLDACVDVKKPLPNVWANPMVLRTVVNNLLSNALKYVAKDVHPWLCIRAEKENGVVCIWFEDNGIGIPVEYQDKIFGVFERLHTGATFSGTGIGLALVRKGLERIGGTVGVISEPGQGSRFWIKLPEAENS